MKTRNSINIKIAKLEFILFLSFVFSTTQGYAVVSADDYYQQNIKNDLPNSDLPSESYYKANIRAGWDEDDGPGGVDEGDNSGVGVPIGDGYIATAMAVIIYTSIIVLKKRRQNKCVKH